MTTKKIPIGVDDFSKISDQGRGFLFIDKTLMIKELIDNGSEVSLIIRPRRWGKTLNMSMLSYFFAAEMNGLSTKGMFDNLNIATIDNGKYLEHQGKYPVIFISFKDVKKDNFNDFIDGVKFLVQEICNQHPQLEHSEKLSKTEKDNFLKLLSKNTSNDELCNALKTLSVLLSKHYGSKVFLLIDEYDTPLNAAYNKDYFNQAVIFFKSMFGAALKGNSALEKGIMTGILRLSKNKMLSDINNLKLYSLIEESYSQYFGFSELEVKYLFSESGITLDMNDVKHWYNGYRSGRSESIYNPWSILNCIDDKGTLKPYWIKTGNEDLLKSVFYNADKTLENKLIRLLEGNSIESSVDEYISFDQIKNGSEDVLWSLLWATGYLKFSEAPIISETGSYVGWLAIPNHEVACSYRAVFPKWIRSFNRIKYDSFLKNLVSGHVDAFVKDLKDYILTIPSYFDFPKESNYHTFLLGLTASLTETHEIHSNKESGFGRLDILLMPRNTENPLAIILELKRGEPTNNTNIHHQAAIKGLQQIETKQYGASLKAIPHIKRILKLCIVFYGKQFICESSFEPL